MADATVSRLRVGDPQTFDTRTRDRAADRGCPEESAARRALRDQIARLDAELGDALLTAFTMRGEGPPPRGARGSGPPRLLDLGELEIVRDELAARLRDAQTALARQAEQQERKRAALERMKLEPGRHRFASISCRELGEPGCGVWQVRPRLGLIGMLMGWWQVKLSSGCPLAAGRARARP